MGIATRRGRAVRASIRDAATGTVLKIPPRAGYGLARGAAARKRTRARREFSGASTSPGHLSWRGRSRARGPGRRRLASRFRHQPLPYGRGSATVVRAARVSKRSLHVTLQKPTNSSLLNRRHPRVAIGASTETRRAGAEPTYSPPRCRWAPARSGTGIQPIKRNYGKRRKNSLPERSAIIHNREIIGRRPLGIIADLPVTFRRTVSR